jgi:hypothetical protein
MDNGNNGHTPYTEEPYDGWARRTRAVGYDIDATGQSWTEAWSLEQTTTGYLYAEARGDADLLPTGHVLADFGFVEAEQGLDYDEDLGWGRKGVRIVVWPDVETAEPVTDLRLRSDGAIEPDGWTSYRAEMLANLYPTEGPARATMDFTPLP